MTANDLSGTELAAARLRHSLPAQAPRAGVNSINMFLHHKRRCRYP